MRVCHCTLGGTKACLGCPNNMVYTGLSLEDVENYYHQKDVPTKGTIERITEKFDQDGKLTERIIEKQLRSDQW